jgi:glycine betaine/proline transport system substrate-binding protein
MATTDSMNKFSTLLAGLLLAVGLASTTAPHRRGNAHPFGAIGWESGALTTEILRLIVERGYGYTTDTLPGSTVSMEVALARNDLQVIAEEWAGRSPAWVKAEQAGQVFALGDTVKMQRKVGGCRPT